MEHAHPIWRYLGTVAAVLITVYLVPGITITDGWLTVLLVALVWSVMVTVVRPVLAILTLPITIITLGLFYFVLNALLFWLVSVIVPGFVIVGFGSALIGSIVLSILSWFIHKVT